MHELQAGRTRDMFAVKPQYTEENDVHEHELRTGRTQIWLR